MCINAVLTYASVAVAVVRASMNLRTSVVLRHTLGIHFPNVHPSWTSANTADLLRSLSVCCGHLVLNAILLYFLHSSRWNIAVPFD